jgi:hypothetical protein
MPGKKGKTNNPNGRPPKNRALTALLEAAGAKTIERDGKPVTRKRFVADALWTAITTGKVTLEDGEETVTLLLATDDWIGLVQFLYKQVDGPPPSEHQLTGANGESLIPIALLQPGQLDKLK